MPAHRIEHDLLGDIAVPESAYFGAQTARAIALVNPSGTMLRDLSELVVAICQVKHAAATTHAELGVIDPPIAEAISAAATEVVDGALREHFVVDVLTGGGGTALHMNVNEVLARRASELSGIDIHPNTHVNMGQSTNDVIPTALSMMTARLLDDVCASLDPLIAATADVAAATSSVVKVARTCLQDAVPMTLGQALGAHVSALKRQRANLERVASSALSVPLGATAVGTGLGAHAGYQPRVLEHLATISGQAVTAADDLFDALAHADAHLDVAATLKSTGFSIAKLAKDLRIMSSGPRAGIAEISLAPTQSGSSIMPGKVNPALPEMMVMAAHRLAGNETAVALAVSDAELDLNVWEPTVIHAVAESCNLLTTTVPVFAEHCVAKITANVDRCRSMAEQSLALAVVVSALEGYETGAAVAERAAALDCSIGDAAIELGVLNAEQVATLLDPLTLTDPERSADLLTTLSLASRSARS